MRHKSPFTWIALVLSALLISTVLSQSGGYDLSWWTINNGGATFSTGNGYSLGATIGQSDAATLSGNGYTLIGGFWASRGKSPGNLRGGPVYLPVVRRHIPIVIIPQCPDDQEPNNSQTAAKRLTTINGACKATLASGAEEEDWYWLDLPPGARIIINLKDVSNSATDSIYLLHFKPDYFVDGQSSSSGSTPGRIELVRSASDTTPCNPATPSESGCRFIVVKHAETSPNSNTYTLQVTIQNN